MRPLAVVSALSTAALAACSGLKDAAPTADAATAPGDDAGGGASDAAPEPSPAPAPPPPGSDAGAPVHLVFVTSAQVDGAFAASAASPWAAADAICANEATANSLNGTFVAWLSYVDANGTSFNAGTRISDVAYYLPGAIADGGASVLVAASKAELLGPGPRVPMDRTATGAQVDQDENAYVTWVWTGTGATGEATSQTCQRWASALSAQSGIAGNARRIPQYSGSDWTTLGGRTCDLRRRFYCFQK